jgi:hypothetical protein
MAAKLPNNHRPMEMVKRLVWSFPRLVLVPVRILHRLNKGRRVCRRHQGIDLTFTGGFAISVIIAFLSFLFLVPRRQILHFVGAHGLYEYACPRFFQIWSLAREQVSDFCVLQLAIHGCQIRRHACALAPPLFTCLGFL